MDKIDIKITQLSKQEFKGLQSSKLTLDISGKSVCPALVNALRRVAYDFVPTYAFTKETITIEENTSVFDNDYMRLRLSQITIPDAKNKIIMVPGRYWLDEDYYANPEREKIPEDNKIFEMYINITNNTVGNINVTTNDAIFIEDGTQLKNVFDTKFPHLIVKLRPKQSFKCRAVAALGIGKRNSIWSAAGHAYYEEMNPNKYKLSIESQGQMDEYEILHKGCEILKKKFEELKFTIGDQIKTSDKTKDVVIKLDNEDHTTGNILNEFLQQNKNIAFSGLSKPDLLVKQVVLKIVSAKNDPVKHIFETLDHLTKIMDDIQKQLVGLGKKHIVYL